MSGRGCWIWLTRVVRIRCVHCIEQKDCTAGLYAGVTIYERFSMLKLIRSRIPYPSNTGRTVQAKAALYVLTLAFNQLCRPQNINFCRINLTVNDNNNKTLLLPLTGELVKFFVPTKDFCLMLLLQCCGSASIFMRIRIRVQDPKNVHMDPDPRG